MTPPGVAILCPGPCKFGFQAGLVHRHVSTEPGGGACVDSQARRGHMAPGSRTAASKSATADCCCGRESGR